MCGAAMLAAFSLPCWAQQATTLNGAPVQLQPYVSEPGVPQVTVNVGTPNPFGGLDTGDGDGSSAGSGSGSSSSGGISGSSDALTTMLGTSWGATAAANAQALGVNASALAATCVLESGCNSNVSSNGSAVGAFQMQSAAYQEGLQTALAADPSLASQIVRGSAGMTDPTTEAIAASGYLMLASAALQNAGVSNPTVVDVRSYYEFGPTYGTQVAIANSSATMGSLLPQSFLSSNNISPSETVADWQASVASTIGSAANQGVLS